MRESETERLVDGQPAHPLALEAGLGAGEQAAAYVEGAAARVAGQR